jgi:hypothetical protein
MQLTLSRLWNQETLEPVFRYRWLEGRESSASFERSPLTDYDLRVHALLTDRILMLSRERHSLWARLRRLNPLARRFS